MRYEIKSIENAVKGMSWSDLGVQPTLGQAYLWSRDAGDELPNFAEVIWDYDIEKIAASCRMNGIKEFTISSTFSGLIQTIATFEQFGFTLEGIVKIKDRVSYFSKEATEIPAFKMVEKEI